MIHELNDKAIAVDVPEGSWNYELYEEAKIRFIGYSHSFHKGRAKQSFVELSPGSWSILGRGSEISEAQAELVCPIDEGLAMYHAHMNYGPQSTALESFHSLLKSKNIPLSSVILVKNNAK
jgi:hypothetical protein